MALLPPLLLQLLVVQLQLLVAAEEISEVSSSVSFDPSA